MILNATYSCTIPAPRLSSNEEVHSLHLSWPIERWNNSPGSRQTDLPLPDVHGNRMASSGPDEWESAEVRSICTLSKLTAAGHETCTHKSPTRTRSGARRSNETHHQRQSLGNCPTSENSPTSREGPTLRVAWWLWGLHHSATSKSKQEGGLLLACVLRGGRLRRSPAESKFVDKTQLTEVWSRLNALNCYSVN